MGLFLVVANMDFLIKSGKQSKYIITANKWQILHTM